MSIYEPRRVYYRTVPETASHFVIPSFPPSTQINPSSLLHFDGPFASEVFNDATGRHSWTGTGSALDSFSKFGGSSCKFITTQHIIGTGDLDFQFETGDFTVDFQVAAPSFAAFNYVLYTPNHVAQPQNFIINWNNDGTFSIFINGVTVIASNPHTTLNQFYHVALTRFSGNMRLFIDGVQEGITYISPEFFLVETTIGPSIGGSLGNSSGLTGWIDEFRVIKGTAAWTAGPFVPPTVPYMVS